MYSVDHKDGSLHHSKNYRRRAKGVGAGGDRALYYTGMIPQRGSKGACIFWGCEGGLCRCNIGSSSGMAQGIRDDGQLQSCFIFVIAMVDGSNEGISMDGRMFAGSIEADRVCSQEAAHNFPAK